MPLPWGAVPCGETHTRKIAGDQARSLPCGRSETEKERDRERMNTNAGVYLGAIYGWHNTSLIIFSLRV